MQPTTRALPAVWPIVRKILFSLFCLTALALLAGCGTSKHIPIPANPSGGNNIGFSNASLTGTYVFNVNGVNIDSSFAAAGTFIADGNGHISSGTRDTVDNRGRQTLNEAITGSYFVNADGRGQVVLNGSSGRAIYRFVLKSSGNASLWQDGTTDNIPAFVMIDAVGGMERQSGTPAPPAGTYVIQLNGEDPGRKSYAALGAIAFTGSTGNGTFDEHDADTFTANIVSSASISLSATRGTASVTVSSGPNAGIHNFIVYFASPTRIVLLGTDPNFLLFGRAGAQSSTAGSTSQWAVDAPEQVFSLSGSDTRGPRVEIGRVTLGATGSLTNAIEDISNHQAIFSAVDLTGSTFTLDSNGRWTANLVNSSGAPSATLVGWQLSPELSIVLTTNSNTVETGTMHAQTLGLTTAQVSGDFAEQLNGVNFNVDVDFSYFELIGQLRLDGAGSLAGRFDEQDDMGLSLNETTSGTYAIDPTLGRTTSGGVEQLHIIMYAVDAQTVYFIPSHSGFIYQGELKQQQP